VNLRVISANTQFGGIGDGSGKRRDALVTFLLEQEPDVLLLQEVPAAGPGGAEGYLRETAGALGMTVAAAGPCAPGAPAGAGHHTAILAGPGMTVIRHGPPDADPWDRVPWAEALIQVPGLPAPVWFYSVHLPPSRHTGQMLHAEKLAATVARRAREGYPAFAAGDFNCLSEADAYTQEQLAAMPLEVWPARVRVLPDGSLEPKLGVLAELAAVGMADIAARLPASRRSPEALTPTGTALGRVDYLLAHDEVAGSVIRYEQVPLPGATDHHVLVLTLSAQEA
jgi:endonuclease/exonuclease/phosphatase family metal-dependent hydrolase